MTSSPQVEGALDARPAGARHPVIANVYELSQKPVDRPHPKAGSCAWARMGAALKYGVTVGTTASTCRPDTSCRPAAASTAGVPWSSVEPTKSMRRPCTPPARFTTSKSACAATAASPYASA